MADFDWDSESAPADAPQPFDWARDAAPEAVAPSPSSSAGGAALRGFGQGLTANFGDELGAGLQSGLQRLANALPEGSLEWAGIDNRHQQDAGDVYRRARDANREQLSADMEQHTDAALAGNLAGGIVSNAIVPGSRLAGGAGLARAGAQGAAAGLGESEADLTRGQVGGAAADTLTGAALGVAGQALGDAVGSGYDKARNWVIQRAQRGQAAAGELARAQAKDLVAKNVQQARSAAGSAASNARNVIENIEGIDIPASNPGRTVGQAKSAVLDQIDALDDALENALAKAKAMGVELGPSPGREGEFLAKGGRLDKAQKAAKSIQALQAARRDLLGEYKSLLGRADDELVTMDVAGLMQARNALRSDPRFEDLKANVLKNSLNDFDRVSADAVAKREAYRQAMAQAPAEEVEVAERLLSGGEALNQAKQRAQRYAAPLAGSLLGGGAGAAVGLAVGNDPTDALLYGLGGAGARPALAAVRRMAGHPAVQNAAWTSIETLAQTAPEAFGRYAGAVTSALARGPEALRALDKVLRDTDPAWRQLRQQQQSGAANR